MIEITHTYDMTLPVVDGVHEVLLAFFQTSKHGPWALSLESPNTQFHLVFRRGDWVKPMLGLSPNLAPAAYKTDHRGKVLPRTQPMTLDVLLRPSRSSIDVNLHYNIALRKPVPFYQRGDFDKYWTTYVREEIEALCKYLTDCFDLPELPRLNPPMK